MHNSLNVHEYDGKLKYYHDLVIIDNNELILDVNYETSINEIKEQAKDILGQNNYKILLHVSDVITKSPNGNHDSSNNISFEDLLPRVWRFYRISPKEMKEIFFEQFSDIVKGFCAQGRSGGRLIQLYEMWMFYLEEFKKDKKDSIDKDIISILTKLKKL